jgi:hypothetical protein
MVEDKKITEPIMSGFYEVVEKTNTEKITNEILAGLSEDSSDSDSFDVESGNEDVEDRLWRPSHVVFGKSTIRQGQVKAMKGKYFHDVSIVRIGGESTVPLPEADEVVVFKSFMKAQLHFPLNQKLFEVLKTFEIYIHQLTTEALIKVGFFIWAMRSQWLKPDAGASVIFTNYLTRWRQPEKNNTITTSAITASCPALRQIIMSLHFRRSGQALGWSNGFTWRMIWIRGRMWGASFNVPYGHCSALGGHQSQLGMKCKRA